MVRYRTTEEIIDTVPADAWRHFSPNSFEPGEALRVGPGRAERADEFGARVTCECFDASGYGPWIHRVRIAPGARSSPSEFGRCVHGEGNVLVPTAELTGGPCEDFREVFSRWEDDVSDDPLGGVRSGPIASTARCAADRPLRLVSVASSLPRYGVSVARARMACASWPPRQFRTTAPGWRA